MKTAFRQIEIVHCSERLNLEKQGLFGFHDSQSCPNCKQIDHGFRVHNGDSVFAPFCGYEPDQDTVIHPNPCYFTR